MPAPSLFSLLDLDSSADDLAIRSAYRQRLRDLHPDRNPGFAKEAARACSELTEQFAAYSADPAAYRAHHVSSTEPDASESVGVPEVDEAIGFASSLVELFAPADRLPAARKAIATGSAIAKRYVTRSRG